MNTSRHYSHLLKNHTTYNVICVRAHVPGNEKINAKDAIITSHKLYWCFPLKDKPQAERTTAALLGGIETTHISLYFLVLFMIVIT